MSVRSESGAKLVVSLQLPHFLLWLLAMPFGIASLVGLLQILSGSMVSGLMLIIVFGGIGVWACVRVSERAELVLDRQSGTVSLTHRAVGGTQIQEFALADLDSAELSRNPKRASGAIELVFTNTRPATRVPITGWGVSNGGMAPLAQKINDWLEQDSGHQ